MSLMEEQFYLLQQQIAALQAERNSDATTPMQSADDTATLPLHSIGARPHYEWYSSDSITEFMDFGAPLNTSPMLFDSQRKHGKFGVDVSSYHPLS